MTRCTPVITHNKHISTPPTWRGFSFALHLLKVQGFYFVPMQYIPIQAFTARFVPFIQLYRQRHKTARRALQALFLRLCALIRPRYQTDTSGYNTACATLERLPTSGHAQPIPYTRRHAGRRTGQHSHTIIIRYIRARPLLWLHARQCSISQTMPARRGLRLPPVDRWQVLHPAHLLRGQRLHLYRVSPAAVSMPPAPGGWIPSTRSAVSAHRLAPSARRGSPVAGARRAARNHWRLPPQLFSGFRPIANRGQQ